MEGSRFTHVDGEKIFFSSNQAGYVAVVPTASGKWQAKPTIGGKQVDFGTFDMPVDAAVAAARAVREHKEGTLVPKLKQDRAPRNSKKRERCAHSKARPFAPPCARAEQPCVRSRSRREAGQAMPPAAPGDIYGVFRNKVGMAKFLQLTLNEGKSDAEALLLLQQAFAPLPAPVVPMVQAVLTLDQELELAAMQMRAPMPYSPPFGPSPVPGGLP